MFNLGSSYFHVALTTVRHLLIVRYNVSASESRPYTRLIHAMYKNADMPRRWLRSARSWPAANRDFAYCYWTDAELAAFVAAEYAWLVPTYDSYAFPIQRCDVVRYMLLYRYAGVYVDLDVGCRVPLSTVLAGVPPAAGVVVAPTLPSGYALDFIGVRRPGDPTMRSVISGLRRAAASRWYLPIPYASIMMRSGPRYFTRRLDCLARQDRIHAIPWDVYAGYVEHVGGTTWHTWDAVVISYLFVRRWQLLRLGVVLAAVAAAAGAYRYRRSIAGCLQNRLDGSNKHRRRET